MPPTVEEIANQTTSRSAINQQQLTNELKSLGARWSSDGTDLILALKGPMAKTGAAAARAGEIADELDHHPTIVIEYAGLTLKIHTHDQKAITVVDLVYAARLEQWLRANGWSPA